MVTPFALLGGADRVHKLVEIFYDTMEAREPELAAVHRLTADGKILPVIRERFGLFLVGWLGGPQTYTETHGHPRLRMRHAPFTVNREAHDAWLRHMRDAVDELGLSEEHEQQL